MLSKIFKPFQIRAKEYCSWITAALILIILFGGLFSRAEAAVPQPLFLVRFEDNVLDLSGNNVITTNTGITTFNDG
jgi:hypothetical protein